MADLRLHAHPSAANPLRARRDALSFSPLTDYSGLPLYRFYYLPIPICVGIALLRYRLWDIDVLINRTLVYGLLTVTLLMVYLALVFAGQALVANVLGRNNGAVLVVSTLIVAALFQPLRRRVQQRRSAVLPQQV